MKQIQFSSFGRPCSVARCIDVPDIEKPSAWEVVVDIEMFPINIADLAILSGDYGTLPTPPATVGLEAVGRVAEYGTAIKDLSVGDRVLLLANDNWSERRKVSRSAIYKFSSDIDLSQSALLKVNPATAHLLLKNFATWEPGDWLIHSAPLSSVGQCIIQLAKAQGIKTVNVVHRQGMKDEILKRGGDVVVEDGPDLKERVRAAIGLEPIRLGLDAVAGPGIQHLAECLSDGGQIVNYGMLSGESCSLSPNQTIFHNISLKGFWLSKILNRLPQNERTALFDTLSYLVAQDQLKMDIDSYFSITDITSALQRAEQRGRQGKVLVYTQFAPEDIVNA
ncbi:MAG: Zn-dependent oxidoreductase [Phormidesmis priestleyi Ana]|uniref:enoyl-[acyl-carrier-protein] reductase n=1 Tax=Phormidesmis priestleyi Ana TaxID=1666911 RepID=A0A0P8DBU3_9CYAN|nr:MAG: Zn-dependent oxidoreductase [Phormidesmis priestleyi Ana]